MTDESDELRERFLGQRFPFLEYLGVGIDDVGAGSARLTLSVRDDHLRPGGIMHGGMAATLLDSALGLAAISQAPPDHDLVTIQLNMNFTRPAFAGQQLVTTGQVVHSGRLTAVSRGEIRTDDYRLIATATATIMFIPVTEDGQAFTPTTS